MVSNAFRCDYCGKFISLRALQDGTANRTFKQSYDWMREDVIEEYHTYHEICRNQPQVMAVRSR